MIVETSQTMIKKSFEKIKYTFQEKPAVSIDSNFGIYLHVPFCYSKCSFCPFYKEFYSDELKQQYLLAIKEEIKGTDMTGKADWVYFGGGTPNTLTTQELGDILSEIKAMGVTADSIGIELLPSKVTSTYLNELAALGFTKISVGVESFSEEILNAAGRITTASNHIKSIVSTAQAQNLWVNIDMMVGLPNQTQEMFTHDIRQLSSIKPNQITIYPFMVIRGLEATPNYSSKQQFELIEQAGAILRVHNYQRNNIWTYTLGSDVELDIYDSSRDELICDYIGFGPAAFSTYDTWKVVNPKLDCYLAQNNKNRMALVAPKEEQADAWRKFSRRIYDLQRPETHDLPLGIKLYHTILSLTGYYESSQLSAKGRYLSHEITKVVVESLPFPIQNSDAITNNDEYVSCTN